VLVACGKLKAQFLEEENMTCVPMLTALCQPDEKQKRQKLNVY